MQVILLKFSQMVINEQVLIQWIITSYESKARRDFKELLIPSLAPRAEEVSGNCLVSTDIAPACFKSTPYVEISKEAYPSASVTPA